MKLGGIVLLLLVPLALLADEGPVVTVLDFQGSGISEGEVTLFTDYVAAHIVGTGRYTVIDRMQRKAMLEEIEFSQGDCTDETCQLQIGRLLSANQIVVGSLGKFGARFILNIKLVEVETGKSLSASSKTYVSLEELLDDSQGLILSLLGNGVPAEAAVAVVPAVNQPEAADETVPKSPESQDWQSPSQEEHSIARASIRTDGRFEDWSEIPATFEDSKGDTSYRGTDIERVFLARDTDFLYIYFRHRRASAELRCAVQGIVHQRRQVGAGLSGADAP